MARGRRAIDRFFAYMNLFVASMLTLLLGNNLLLPLAGMGRRRACAAILLIGFWYRVPANGAGSTEGVHRDPRGRLRHDGRVVPAVHAARHAADSGSDAARLRAVAGRISWAVCGQLALLLLGGAVGKSAQIPLQVWLPDAMAGPTPTSALLSTRRRW